MEWLLQGLIGASVGVAGTGLGGAISYFMRGTQKILGPLMAASSGMMLAVSLVDLVPESLNNAGTLAYGAIALGMALVFFLGRWVAGKEKSGPGLRETGIMMGISIALHNLPEGLAIGSGFVSPANIGPSLALVILLHNIPEGLAMGVPLKASGLGASIVGYAMLSGLPEGIGAVIGYGIGGISSQFYGLCMGFAAGAMILVVYKLLVQAFGYGKRWKSALGLLLGAALGFLISILI
ncbi:MAG: ZIP family metal transporter [Christensenellales bacterium]|jgi:ZIP family zinc transporter